MATLLLIGCAPPEPPADTLVVAQATEPRSLDPRAASALDDQRVLANLYEGLVAYRPGTLEPMPALAHSWKISDQGRSYLFRLKSGVRFHDGTPLNAEAVVRNFRRLLDAPPSDDKTGPSSLHSLYGIVNEIEASGVLAVRFRLKAPFAPFLAALASPSGLLVSPTAVERWGRDFGEHPVGSGPYRFVEWVPGQRIVLERSDLYHRQAPRLRRLVFRPITGAMTQVAELMTGGVDVALGLSPEAVAAFRDRAGFQVLERTGPQLWYLALNLRESPFDDRRMRLAANLAVYKDGLVRNVLADAASVAAGPVPEAFGWAYNRRLAPFPYDPQQARRLVSEAGHKSRGPLRLLIPAGGSRLPEPAAMAAAIGRDLALGGLAVEIEQLERGAYRTLVEQGLSGRGHLALMASWTNDPDTLPAQALRCGALPEQGGFNVGYYCDAETDRLIEQARSTTNKLRRTSLYRKLADKVHGDAPWLEVASRRMMLVANDRVRGLELEPTFLLGLTATWKQQ